MIRSTCDEQFRAGFSMQEIRDRIRMMSMATVRDFGYDFRFYVKSVHAQLPHHANYVQRLQGCSRFREWLPKVVAAKMQQERDEFARSSDDI